MMNASPSGPDRVETLLVVLACLALAGTWAQAFGYLELGFIPGNVRFWQETVATPASTFIVVDILVLAAAIFIWMFPEGRRVGIGGGWLWGYFVACLVIGISFAIPLFLAHRHRRLRRERPAEAAVPAGGDWLAIGLGIAIAVSAVAYSLRHLP